MKSSSIVINIKMCNNFNLTAVIRLVNPIFLLQMEALSKNKELHALVSLLDEPNDSIYFQIKGQILLHGINAIPYLEDLWDNSLDDIVQERSETIIHEIQFKSLKSDFKIWKEKAKPDLLEGLFLISKYQYPELNLYNVKKEIDSVYKNIWLEFNDNLTALEKIRVFNHIFYDIHRFKADKKNINRAESYYLSHVLQSKKGVHLSLGGLYIVLAQRLGLPVFGVNLPHHFILAYIDPYHLHNDNNYLPEDVLFYINPFFNGAVFTKSEIDVYLKQIKLKPIKQYYIPQQANDLIKQSLKMLELIYKNDKKFEKSSEVSELISLL